MKRLQQEDGSWVEEEALRQFIQAQYHELFSSQGDVPTANERGHRAGATEGD